MLLDVAVSTININNVAAAAATSVKENGMK